MSDGQPRQPPSDGQPRHENLETPVSNMRSVVRASVTSRSPPSGAPPRGARRSSPTAPAASPAPARAWLALQVAAGWPERDFCHIELMTADTTPGHCAGSCFTQSPTRGGTAMKILTNMELYAVAGSWVLFILVFVTRGRGARTSLIARDRSSLGGLLLQLAALGIVRADLRAPGTGLLTSNLGVELAGAAVAFALMAASIVLAFWAVHTAGQAVEPGGSPRGGSRADHRGPLRDDAPPDLHRHARHAGRQRHCYKPVAGAAWRCGPVPARHDTAGTCRGAAASGRVRR